MFTIIFYICTTKKKIIKQLNDSKMSGDELLAKKKNIQLGNTFHSRKFFFVCSFPSSSTIACIYASKIREMHHVNFSSISHVTHSRFKCNKKMLKNKLKAWLSCCVESFKKKNDTNIKKLFVALKIAFLSFVSR